MHWIILILAGFCEVGFAFCLGKTKGLVGLPYWEWMGGFLLFYVLTSPSTPLRYKQIIIGALGYFILPTDLLPDFIPGIGFADDLAAVLAVVKIVMSCITPEIKSKALAKSQSYL